MEEVLTGELTDTEAVQHRAAHLLDEFLGRDDTSQGLRPSPVELARNVLKTLALEDIARLRPQLVPEFPIWSQLPDGSLLAGRADAVAIADGQVAGVLDWKSDVAPTSEDRSRHAGQLRDYLSATGAGNGALVYMSLGQVLWIARD